MRESRVARRALGAAALLALIQAVLTVIWAVALAVNCVSAIPAVAVAGEPGVASVHVASVSPPASGRFASRPRVRGRWALQRIRSQRSSA